MIIIIVPLKYTGYYSITQNTFSLCITTVLVVLECVHKGLTGILPPSFQHAHPTLRLIYGPTNLLIMDARIQARELSVHGTYAAKVPSQLVQSYLMSIELHLETITAVFVSNALEGLLDVCTGCLQSLRVLIL